MGKRSRPIVSLLVMCMMLVTGCGLSKETLTKVEQAKVTVTNAERNLTERKNAFASEQQGQNWSFYLPYAQRENWANNFSEAEAELVHTKSLVNEIDPLVKLNKREKTRSIEDLIARLEASVRSVNTKSKVTASRMAELLKTRDEAPQLVGVADRERLETAQVFRNLETFTNEARARHTARTSDIDTRFAPFVKLSTTAQAAFSAAKQELEKSQSNQVADYAILADSVKTVSSSLAEITKQDPAYRKKIGELDTSYTKTLIDMQQRLRVVVGRTSWDEDADFATEHDYEYPAVEVDDPTFDYFDAMADSTVIATYGGWTGYQVSADAGMVSKLNIDPKANWPSSWDDTAEYWLADTTEMCQHRYSYEENGNTREGDWEDVDCDTYEQHFDDIGMTLAAKPYGAFEEEKQTQAAPAGMAYVGNQRYGEWRQDPNTGDSFWEFYGKYAMFRDILGGPVYRHDWDDWNTNYRGRQPYYGDDDDNPRWGSGSAQAQSRYSSTTFAKRGGLTEAGREAQATRTASGGMNRGDSVRGAGPIRRAGGPGGGGK